MQRDLLREYRSVFTKNGIDLSFPQVVVNQTVVSGVEVSEKQKKKAEKFKNEQADISKGIEDDE